MTRDSPSLKFARDLLPRGKASRKGDPMPSTLLGSPSIVLGIVNAAAILGRGPASVTGLVKQATVVLAEPTGITLHGEKIGAGWWFVPEVGFWMLATSGMALAAIGIISSRGRGRPIAGLVGFGLNAVVAVAGYVLAFTDFRR